jgi:hypothetical protein
MKIPALRRAAYPGQHAAQAAFFASLPSCAQSLERIRASLKSILAQAFEET